MKQRKTIAALSLLLAGCIGLSACGGEAAEPPPDRQRRKFRILPKIWMQPL